MFGAAVAGAGVGAGIGLLGSKGSKGGNVTSVQSRDPWSGVQPYLSQGYQQASGLLNQGPNPQTQAMLRNRGMFGSPVTQEAQNLATGTLRGDYLNANPFQDKALQDAMGMTQSRINSQFAGNNFGSSAHQEWLGRGLMGAAMPYLSQNYENERGRQFQAMSQAPALAGQDFQDIGAVQQADMMPWDFLGRYQQTIGGLQSGGGTSTTQNPYFTNPVNSALGGALLGNQLYNSFKQPNTSTYGSPNDMSSSWMGI